MTFLSGHVVARVSPVTDFVLGLRPSRRSYLEVPKRINEKELKPPPRSLHARLLGSVESFLEVEDEATKTAMDFGGNASGSSVCVLKQFG